MLIPRMSPRITRALRLLLHLLVALAVLVAGTATAAHAAEEERTFHFVGGGHGHGVGLSQYGALGRAEAGFSNVEILQFYYTDVEVVTDPALVPDDVRVRIAVHSTTEFTPEGQLSVAMDGEFLDTTLNRLRVQRLDGGWHINSSGFDWCDGFCPGTVLTVSFNTGEPVRVAGIPNGTRRYARGQFQLTPAGPGVNRCGRSSANEYCLVVGDLTMQEYLYGLDEMPQRWHTEALKAQAIAGRSSAVARMLERAGWGEPFNLYTSTTDQEYHAWDHEAEIAPQRPWADVVDATDDTVVTYTPTDGLPYVIKAFFSPSNGGYTADPEVPWHEPLVYLEAKPDPYDAAPGTDGNPKNRLHLWHRSYSYDQVSRWLADYPHADLDVGDIQEIRISGAGPAGWIDDALVTLVGSKRTLEVRNARGKPYGYRFYNAMVLGCRATTGCRPFLSTKIALVGSPPDVGDGSEELETDVDGPEFTDVPADAPYEEAISWMARNGITEGTTATTFSPDESLSRAQFATFLWRYAGRPNSDTNRAFTDVEADSYYASAVAWMVAAGITEGCEPNRFCPHEPLTAAQIAAFLWRYAGRTTSQHYIPFFDIYSEDYFLPAVRWMLEWDIWVDEDFVRAWHGTIVFKPHEPISRSRMAVFLWQLAAAPGALSPDVALSPLARRD